MPGKDEDECPHQARFGFAEPRLEVLERIPSCPDLQSPRPPASRGQDPLPTHQAPTTSGLLLTMKVALSPERTAGPEDSSTSGVRSGGEERALPS